MVIKYFGPNDKRGVYWPPYTAQERREREAQLYRKHGGPYVVVYPYARGKGPSLPSREAARASAAHRRTEATSQSAQEAVELDAAMTQRLKPTKKLALEVANMLELSALGPDEELDWNAVRELTASITGEGKLDDFQLGLLTDWVHEIAAARLGWRRRRPAGKRC